MAAALLFLVAGCPAPTTTTGDGGNAGDGDVSGDGGSADMTGAGAPATAGEACTKLLNGLVAQGVSCNSGIDLIFSPEQITYTCSNLQKLQDMGTMMYDKTAYAACEALVTGTTCLALDDTFSATCNKIFVGTKSGGVACISSNECVSNSCDNGATCPGKCRAQADAGGDCTNAECKSGYTCSSTRKCVVFPTEGQSCAGSSCGSGLYCDVNRICQKKKIAGASCPRGDECGSGLSCKAMVCVMPKKIGDTCNNTTDQCQLGAFCETTCKKWPVLGGDCGQIAGQFVSCLEGYCKIPSMSTTGLCTAKVAANGTCTQSNECVIGTDCVKATVDGGIAMSGTCTTRLCF